MGKFRENYFDQFGEMMIGDFEEMLHQDPQLKLYYKLLTTLLEREDYLDRRVEIELLTPHNFKLQLLRTILELGVKKTEIRNYDLAKALGESEDIFDHIYLSYYFFNYSEIQKQTLSDFLKVGYIDLGFRDEIDAINDLTEEGIEVKLEKVVYHFSTPKNEARTITFKSNYWRHNFVKKFKEIQTEIAEIPKKPDKVKFNTPSDYVTLAAQQKKLIAIALLRFLQQTDKFKNKPETKYSNDQLVAIGKAMVIFNVFLTESQFYSDKVLTTEYKSNTKRGKRTAYEKYLQQNAKTLIG